MTAAAPHIAIIGAGFSGLLTALHLLRTHPTLRISLIEREEVFGPGTAYTTVNPDHVLNVRLANMSAFPDQPDHLSRWLAARPQWRARDGFITRGDYGAYLTHLLEEASADPSSASRLALVRGSAVRLSRLRHGWQIILADQTLIDADQVILAIGNLEPAPLAGLDPALADSPLYIADPWRAATTLPDRARKVMVIGTGLTMVDVVIGLARNGRRFTAVSRRGLLPQAHALQHTRHETALPYHGSLRAVLRQVRERAGQMPWRSVLDEVRHDARALWQNWSLAERQRFLRHLRPYWDVHRHRLAPSVANRVTQLLQSGALGVIAGKITALRREGDRVRVHWRPRGATAGRALLFDAVVNCTGPLGALQDSASPLIQSLIADGLLVPDPNGLGALVGPCCGLVDASGAVQTDLHAVGPLTRGAFWEMTSVPDLRVQARDVAVAIAARLA